MESHSIFILLSVLFIIFSLTYFIHVKQKKRLRHLAHKQEPRFGLNSVVSSLDSESEAFLEEDTEMDLLAQDPLLQPSTPKKTSESPPLHSSKTIKEEIIYLVILSKPDKPYQGYELLQALLAAGLRFGAMNIFHRHEDMNGNGKILFSLANASEQGTFEINKMGAFSGKGLMIFQRLSYDRDLIANFEIMLETAKQLTEDLGGDILDDTQKILTPDRIEEMKKKILEFEQKQLIGDLFDQ